MSNKAAIIIPFRDSFCNNERYEALDILSKNIKKICEKYNQEYEILVIHQKDDFLFNKSCLMNVGASIAINNCDYFIFHDVDNIPIDEYNMYQPRNISGCLVYQRDEEIFDINSTYFGGVIYINKKDYIIINGFCNYFWGWGWEDSAIRERLEFHKIPIERGKGKFYKLFHETKHRYLGNPNFINNAILYNIVNTKINDGYCNLNYDISHIERKNTHLTIYDIKIQPPQYDLTKILNNDELIELIGDYNPLWLTSTIEKYSK